MKIRKQAAEKKKWTWIWGCGAAAACSLMACFLRILANGHSEWIEQWYSRGLYPIISQFLSFFSGLFPFSVAELLLVIGIPLFLLALLIAVLRRKTKWYTALSLLLATVCALFSIYTCVWSLNYYRQPYAVTAGLEVRESTPEELHALCVELIEKAKVLRSAAAEDTDGVFLPSQSFSEQRLLVQDAYDTLSESMPWLGGRYGAPKGVLLSEGLMYLDIAGIFIPHTIEANVNTRDSLFQLPATACHEAAHQRGWAREDEANFIAYLVCVSYRSADFQYSGDMLAIIHAMNALYKADYQLFCEAYAHYNEAMLRDLRAHSERWAPYKTPVSEKAQKVNDSYLKYNNQEDGVQSYGRMVDLLLAWQRKSNEAE